LAAAEPDFPAPQAARSSLGSRIVVGGFLAVVAAADIWIGGTAFAIMIAAFVCLVFWEWGAMHQTPRPWRLAGVAVLVGVSVLSARGDALDALLLLALAFVTLLLLSAATRLSGKRLLSTGLLYAGLPAIALIWMRDRPDGFPLVMWAMGLVWATDTFAYVAGRAIGGPKLWPSVSPNKTWAGLVGGVAAAALFSFLFARLSTLAIEPMTAAFLGAGLAIVAQGGDLFESWLKRRAGVKDSGRLLPGHGGIMDRVDGLVPVSCVVAAWVAATSGAPA
jgi:phosphatidate cytidylyltransferase